MKQRLVSLLLCVMLVLGVALIPAQGAEVMISDLYDVYGYGDTLVIRGTTDMRDITVMIAPIDANSMVYYQIHRRTEDEDPLSDGITLEIPTTWATGVYRLVVGSGTTTDTAEFIVTEESQEPREPNNSSTSTGGNRGGQYITVKLNQNDLTLRVGESAKVAVQVSENGASRTASWQTDDADLISINGTKSATITALKAGEAKAWIYVGDYYDTLRVTILPKEEATEPPTERPTEKPTEPTTEEPTEPVTEPEIEVSFSDLESVSWAENSILSLARRGVVRGTADGIFSPNDNVTRAQFVLMLVNAFGFEKSDKAVIFSDARPGDWYYDAVVTAASLGIVNGYEDGSFGADQAIARQDAAVLAGRAAQQAGITLRATRDAIVFADADAIAPYALDAVTAMQRAGILNGLTEDTFGPSETATRAQAAHIIYLLDSLR